MKVYFLPSYQQRAPSTRMRVYKIADYFKSQNQSFEILPYNLPIQEKQAQLATIQPDDILYVQKWRTDFNSADYVGQYKNKCKIIFDIDDLSGDKVVSDLILLCDALVVGNHFLQDRYKNIGKPLFLVPSPVDLEEYPEFRQEGSLSISLAKCGIAPMLGPLNKLKDALLKLKEKYNYHLILVGFNNRADELKAKEMFPFAKCIRLRTYDEYLKNTAPLLQETTIGILPFTKRDEGKSGHSALANLAMGVPCIASKYAECNYIIQDGVNGFLVNSPNEWYNKIETLFNSPVLRTKFREAGWKTIEEKYNVPIVGQQLLDSLRKI